MNGESYCFGTGGSEMGIPATPGFMVIGQQGRDLTLQPGVPAAGLSQPSIALRDVALQGFLEQGLNLLPTFHTVCLRRYSFTLVNLVARLSRIRLAHCRSPGEHWLVSVVIISSTKQSSSVPR